MKNINVFKRNWNQTKVLLKQKFAMLTDSDLHLDDGNHDDILERLQVRLGKSKEEIHKLIAEL